MLLVIIYLKLFSKSFSGITNKCRQRTARWKNSFLHLNTNIEASIQIFFVRMYILSARSQVSDKLLIPSAATTECCCKTLLLSACCRDHHWDGSADAGRLKCYCDLHKTQRASQCKKTPRILSSCIKTCKNLILIKTHIASLVKIWLSEEKTIVFSQLWLTSHT